MKIYTGLNELGRAYLKDRMFEILGITYSKQEEEEVFEHVECKTSMECWDGIDSPDPYIEVLDYSGKIHFVEFDKNVHLNSLALDDNTNS